MTKNITLASVAGILALAAATASAQQACSCCSKPTALTSTDRVAAILASFNATPEYVANIDAPPLPEETVVVLDELVAIQKALAGDSMDDVAHHATAIVKAVNDDKVPGLSPESSVQAAVLAKTKDIRSAREAFKKLNESFGAFLKEHPDSSGKYRTAYCPMAKAGWVQTGDSIANPYFGRSMLKCGSFKN